MKAYGLSDIFSGLKQDVLHRNIRRAEKDPDYKKNEWDIVPVATITARDISNIPRDKDFIYNIQKIRFDLDKDYYYGYENVGAMQEKIEDISKEVVRSSELKESSLIHTNSGYGKKFIEDKTLFGVLLEFDGEVTEGELSQLAVKVQEEFTPVQFAHVERVNKSTLIVWIDESTYIQW